MPVRKVKQGDCIATLARGFQDWKVVYDAPENEELRKKRPNPNVLYEGDEVFVPDKKLRWERGATGQSHKFKLKAAEDWLLRLRLTDQNGEPLADAKYRLTLGSKTIEDSSDSEGFIETSVDPQLDAGTLETLGQTITLHLGQLDPVSRVRGVQQRLNQLGYDAGPADGDLGPRTHAAARRFRAAHPDKFSDDYSGIDDDTRKLLLELHDDDTEAADAEDDFTQQALDDGDDGDDAADPAPEVDFGALLAELRERPLSQDTGCPETAFELTVVDNENEPLAGAEVQVLQGEVEISVVTLDENGKALIVGHDPDRPCEIVLVDRDGGCAVEYGGAAEDPSDGELPEYDPGEADEAEAGCYGCRLCFRSRKV